MPLPDKSQDLFIVTHYFRLSAQAIADQLGWTKSKVMRCIKRLDLPSKYNPETYYSVEELVYIAQHKNKKPLAEIAAHLGRSVEGVRLKANRIGLTERDDVYTEEEDNIIKEMFNTLPYAEIGLLLNRTQEGVRARAKVLQITGDKTYDPQRLMPES